MPVLGFEKKVLTLLIGLQADVATLQKQISQQQLQLGNKNTTSRCNQIQLDWPDGLPKLPLQINNYKQFEKYRKRQI